MQHNDILSNSIMTDTYSYVVVKGDYDEIKSYKLLISFSTKHAAILVKKTYHERRVLIL